MTEQKPKLKYDFKSGKDIKKIKKFGYKYLGKGKIGNIKSIKVNDRRAYFLEDLSGIGRLSSYIFDKSKFKKVAYWEEDVDWGDDWVFKQKPKKKIEINTRIAYDKKGTFLRSPRIKLTKEDDILFFRINESEIIKLLQLKAGSKIKITIEKKWQNKNFKKNKK